MLSYRVAIGAIALTMTACAMGAKMNGGSTSLDVLLNTNLLDKAATAAALRAGVDNGNFETRLADVPVVGMYKINPVEEWAYIELTLPASPCVSPGKLTGKLDFAEAQLVEPQIIGSQVLGGEEYSTSGKLIAFYSSAGTGTGTGCLRLVRISQGR